MGTAAPAVPMRRRPIRRVLALKRTETLRAGAGGVRWHDPAHGRLLIAEEDNRVGSTLRDYSMDGRFLGRNLPPFEDDAEGVTHAVLRVPDKHEHAFHAEFPQARPMR